MRPLGRLVFVATLVVISTWSAFPAGAFDHGSSEPPTVPESPTAPAVKSTLPVRLPRSGTVGVSVTLSTGAASVVLSAGAKVTLLSGAPFTGILHPPYRVAERTDGRVVGAHQVGVNGLGPDGEIRFDPPLTLNLPVPAGDDVAAYQPVAVALDGSLTYLLPKSGVTSARVAATATTVSVSVDRLRSGVNHFGLARVARPAVAAADGTVAATPGYHSRWAGQSATAELSPGQLVDVSVRFRNAGDQPWVRGAAGQQANLGSAAPLDNTRDYERGILIAPVAGKTRYATTTETTVVPGDVGTFAMRLRAPAEAGTYTIFVRPVIEGTAWLEDEGVFLELVVR